MKNIKKLAANVSLAVLMAAGTVSVANAIESNSIDVSAIGSQDPSNNVGYAPIPFASEVTNTADNSTADDRDDGVAVIEFEPTTGTWPSGNVLFDVTITNAGFDGAMSGTAFQFGACTAGLITTLPNANVSTGGADNATTVTYVVSNLNSCEAGEVPTLTVPFDLSMAGSMTVQIGVRTEGGVPVDNGPATYTVVALADAYNAYVFADGTTHVADVLATPAYTNFFTPGPQTLGGIQLFADTDVYTDLSGLVAVAGAGDFVTASAVTTGSYAAFQAINGGDVELDGFTATVAGNTATVGYNAAGSGGNDTIADIVTAAGTAPTSSSDAFVVTADTTSPIAASSYSTSLSYTLAAGFSAQSAVAGSLDSITRNGTSETLPWTASATQAAGTGSTTFVRISNPTSVNMGAVSARVASSTNSGTVGNSAVLSATLPAGTEQLFTSADLEALLGNFGRGDIEISVEGNGAFITRLLQRPDGTLEINNRD